MNQLQPGQMLGPDRIISQIGQGGMATVYKAYQPSMDRNVAVKVLPGQLAESKVFTKRFQQEAHIIAKLDTRTSCRSSIMAKATASLILSCVISMRVRSRKNGIGSASAE